MENFPADQRFFSSLESESSRSHVIRRNVIRVFFLLWKQHSDYFLVNNTDSNAHYNYTIFGSHLFRRFHVIEVPPVES